MDDIIKANDTQLIEEGDIDIIPQEVRYNDELKSWLAFNSRVLNEAKRKINPIMERLNFVGIADSNLDEFIRSKFKINKGLRKDIVEQTKQIETTYLEIIEELKSHNIFVTSLKDIDNKEYKLLKKYFKDNVFPILQPLVLKGELPIPDLSDGGSFLVTRLESDGANGLSGIIRLPDNELIQIKGISKSKYFYLSEIIKEFIGFCYRERKIIWNKEFRVFRKIDSLMADDKTNYLITIKNQLRQREKAEIMMTDIVSDIIGIEAIVGNSKKRKRKFPQGLGFIKKFIKSIDYNEVMFYPTSEPKIPIGFIGDNIFDIITKRDILVHFPYESFDMSSVRLVEEASVDPNVLSIKQTLYRVSQNSRLTDALMNASRNGKQVTVLLELKAKMDESHNLELVESLKSAGCNIIFGPVQIKTHAKVTLIIRKEGNKLAKYCNISTGNFNSDTAKVYEDISLFCKDRNKFKVGDDLIELFNYLGGYSILSKFKEILVSPINFRSTIEYEIDKCILFKNENPDKPVTINLKTNALTDTNIAEKIYAASAKGVTINLIVRGMCIVKPEVPGLSENVHLSSVLGRYLEHSRIYEFCCDDKRKVYIGSGDLMPRNLDYRVEVLVPIKHKELKDQIHDILDMYFKDTLNTYRGHDDQYDCPINENPSDSDISVQNSFIELYTANEKSILR